MLPTSRNTNFSPGATVVKAVDLNDIQDAIVGHKRAPWTRTFYPKFFDIGGGSFVGGVNPVNAAFQRSLNSATAVNTFADIPFDDGDRLIGFKYWAAGNGTVDLIAGSIIYSPTIGQAGSSLGVWSDNNRAATWGLVDVGTIAAGPSFTPQLLVAGAVLQIQLVTNAAGYSIGPFLGIFDRL